MVERTGLTYNTDRPPILIREYGRIIQEVVHLIRRIPDRTARSRAAARVVKMMAALHPNFTRTEENWHKLWDHLFIIAGYDLDIDAPFPPPQPAEKFPPQKISYPTYEVKYRFLGKNVESLVEKALKLPDPEMQAELLNIIAGFMRMSYRQWNKDFLPKGRICRYLHELSGGKFDEAWLCEVITLSDEDQGNSGSGRNRHRSRHRYRRR